MDKKKFLTASLASVAVLGSAFVVSQPSIVKAEGQPVASSQPAGNKESAQKDFLANYDEALKAVIAELEKAETNSPEEAKAKADTIAALKAASDATRKQIVEGFEKGLTVEEAEKLIDKANEKAAEEDKEAAAKEEAAQKEFLANYDAALKAAIAELEKAETNSPEEAKAKSDTIAALKAASDETRKQIVEGFKKGLTAKQAEKFIDELNKKAAEEDKEAAAKEKAAQEEFLANYDQALKDAIAELEKAETNSPEEAKAKADTIAALKAASDATRKQIVEGFEKGLTVEEAEKLIDKANEKAAEEDKEAAAKEEAAQKEFLANYDAALKAAIAELEKAETNSPEEAKAKSDTIAALKAASDETRKQIVEGFKKGLTAKQAEKFIDELNKKAAEEDKAKEKPAEKPAETPVKPSVPARPANPTYVPSYVPSYSSYSVVEPAKPASPKTGWKQENGVWYFYNTDGSMATGWLKDNGTWYYLNANGAMATGWLQNNGSWYYLNSNGAMATGWLKDNGTWYYLNANGAMATGWLKDNGTWYYLNVNGAMVTGWLKDGDTWYYLEASGAMKVSQWFKVSDKWYYVDGSGALAVNTTVNGYTVNGNGEWV